MSDTPITPPTFPPASPVESIKGLVGDLARPFAIYATSFGAAVATIQIAQKVMDGTTGAIFIAAVFTGVGALYGAKAWETAQTGKQAASVQIAQVTGTAPVTK